MAATERMGKTKGNMVVLRISDSNAVKELDAQVVEAGEMYPQLPGADQLKRLGAKPLLDPSLVDGVAHGGPGFRAVVFRLPGKQTTVLMVLGSATKANLGDDDNAFVALLADTLRSGNFESLWVADFARLVRSIDYLSDTWKAVRSQTRYVRHGGAVIDTMSPTAEIQFLFEALTAAADARSVVRRTLKGKMRRYVAGKCPLRRRSVPIGYTRDESGELGVDPALPRSVVRTIVQALGDPSLKDHERVETVKASAVASSNGVKSPNRSLGYAKNPTDAVMRWFRLLDVWRTGEWVVKHDIPALLDNDQFELPVEIREAKNGRFWRMAFTLAVPKGGWATEDEFEAATREMDRRQARSSTGGAATGGARKPFCEMGTWEEGEWEYILMSRAKGLYDLRRRPKEQAWELRSIGGEERRVARGWGRSPHLEGDLVERISAAHLHETLARGLVDAAVSGLEVQAAGRAILDSEVEIADEIREQIATLRRRERNARRNANEAMTDEERRGFLCDQQTASSEAAELEADLFRVAATSDTSIRVDADSVATALAAVAKQPNHVPREVADALRNIIEGFRLVPLNESKAVWQASLRVPVGGGSLHLGPAHGVLEFGTSRTLARRRTASLVERAAEAAHLVMADGNDAASAAKKLQVATHRRVAQVVRDHLKELGLSSAAASYLVSGGTDAARKVLWERLHDRPFPREIDRPLAAHLEVIYREGTVPGRNSHQDSWVARAQRALDVIASRGGWVPESDFHSVAAEVGIWSLVDYLKGRRRPSIWHPPILKREAGGASLLPCPHRGCGGWATVVTLHPETPTDVLCATCMRMPDQSLSALVFPAEYR